MTDVSVRRPELTRLRASVDLGTNTCLLLIAEVDPHGKVLRVVEDHANVVRLGEGVDQAKRLQPEPMQRTIVCLVKYAERVRQAGLKPEEVICVATAQARDAVNGAEFFAKVLEAAGFSFRVITGEQEAKYSFLGGLLPGMDPAQSVVIDIGGGSTEFATESGGVSLQMGSVRLTERFLKSSPVTDAEFWACQEWVDAEILRAVPASVKRSALVGVAGTVTTLAQWQRGLLQFDASELDGMELTRGDVHRAVEELKWRNSQERRSLPGMDPRRADVILGGALILWRAMEVLGFQVCTVSTRGLRFGIMEVQ